MVLHCEMILKIHTRIHAHVYVCIWKSLVGYSPWGRKELDTTEQRHSIIHIYHYHLKNGISVEYQFKK